MRSAGRSSLSNLRQKRGSCSHALVTGETCARSVIATALPHGEGRRLPLSRANRYQDLIAFPAAISTCKAIDSADRAVGTG